MSLTAVGMIELSLADRAGVTHLDDPSRERTGHGMGRLRHFDRAAAERGLRLCRPWLAEPGQGRCGAKTVEPAPNRNPRRVMPQQELVDFIDVSSEEGMGPALWIVRE